jgi:hypothetical protein
MPFTVTLFTSSTLAGAAFAQRCEDICIEYKSFARRAGDPSTLERLMSLTGLARRVRRGPVK